LLVELTKNPPIRSFTLLNCQRTIEGPSHSFSEGLRRSSAGLIAVATR